MKVRQEDLRMKIPALLHLSRLGYGYISKAQLRRRDRKTNILPETLKTAAEQINHTNVSPEAFFSMTDELRNQLDANDLGRQFYTTLRDGWNGLRLIDFEHPENNFFQSASELVCGSGSGSFRPDITLFVNGLPLAMIEVKTGDRPGGLREEYDRMLERFRCTEARRYLQCAQVWAFSDDHGDDPNRLRPMEGAFFATVMTDDFPVCAAGGKRSGGCHRLLPRNADEERRILEDNGMPEKPHTSAFRRSLSPEKTTHRMLTRLFHPEQFLFLLRYGIRYTHETDFLGQEILTRRILTTRQLSALEALIGKAKRGYRNWTTIPCGAAGENAVNASLIALVRDLVPGAEVYWVSADEEELPRDQNALQSCGISCATRGRATREPLILVTAEEAPETRLRGREERDDTDRRVFILPQPVSQYGQKPVLNARLRRSEPNAILITRKTNRVPENSFPEDLSAYADGTLYYFHRFLSDDTGIDLEE